MPDVSYLSSGGAKLEAESGQSALANAVLRLFKFGFNPTPTTPLADFVSNECDFDGYAPITIAAWADPILAGAGYAIYAPVQTFRWEHDTEDIGNSVGGAFLVTPGGDLYQFTIFDPSRPCQGPDQAVLVGPTDFYPWG